MQSLLSINTGITSRNKKGIKSGNSQPSFLYLVIRTILRLDERILQVLTHPLNHQELNSLCTVSSLTRVNFLPQQTEYFKYSLTHLPIPLPAQTLWCTCARFSHEIIAPHAAGSSGPVHDSLCSTTSMGQLRSESRISLGTRLGSAHYCNPHTVQ